MDNAELEQAVETVISKEQINVFKEFFDQLPHNAMAFGLRVLISFVAFVVGYYFIKFVRKLVKLSLERAKADLGVIQFTDSFLKTILYTILVFTIATRFGLDAASVLAILGSIGVAIGLALQGSLSNFAGGILILILKPFVVGDYIIEDSKKNEGIVTQIQLFYTKLETFDGKIIVLPNGTLANTSLTNVTTTKQRRVEVKVGISYEADLVKAKDAINQIMNQDERILKDPEPFVYVDELGNSAVILGIRCFVNNEDYFMVKCKLLEEIKLDFERNEIEIPYPQVVIHKKSKK